MTWMVRLGPGVFWRCTRPSAPTQTRPIGVHIDRRSILVRISGRFTTVATVTALVLASATAASAAPPGAGLVQVSHGSPFAGCTIGGTPTSTLFPGAEVEP